MCLGVPMRIIDIDGFEATCEARDVQRRINLFLLQHETLSPGDLVMVHRGQAIAKMDEAESKAVWALLEEMLERESEAAATQRRTHRA